MLWCLHGAARVACLLGCWPAPTRAKLPPLLVWCRPYIMDLGSTNGTFLNGERLEAERYYELLEKVRLAGPPRCSRHGEGTAGGSWPCAVGVCMCTV